MFIELICRYRSKNNHFFWEKTYTWKPFSHVNTNNLVTLGHDEKLLAFWGRDESDTTYCKRMQPYGTKNFFNLLITNNLYNIDYSPFFKLIIIVVRLDIFIKYWKPKCLIMFCGKFTSFLMMQNYTFISMSARNVPSFEMQNPGHFSLTTIHQYVTLSAQTLRFSQTKQPLK